MNIKNEKKIDGLIKKAQEGDTNSFGEIYDIYLNNIYQFIFYKVTHKEIAEDLTEESFFKAWVNLKKYKKQSCPFSSWLYRISNNTVIDYLRKEKIKTEELMDEMPDKNMSAKKDAEQYYNQKLLKKALSKLPNTQKEVIILKYINELKNKEIALILKKSDTAVRILISRALKKLKEIMKNIEI